MQAARRSLYQGDGPAAWSASLQIVRDWPEEDYLRRAASLVQLRQPIYRSSAGRSAALLDHLRPLVEALGPLGPEPA